MILKENWKRETFVYREHCIFVNDVSRCYISAKMCMHDIPCRFRFNFSEFGVYASKYGRDLGLIQFEL